MPLCVSRCPGPAEAEDSARPRCACTQCRKWLPAAQVHWAGGVNLFVVQPALSLGRNNLKERSFRSSERKPWAFLLCLGCNVVVLSLLVAFRTKTGEEPSRSFEDLRGEPQTFGEPSRSFEFLRGPSRDPHKTFGEPSRSFEFLRGIAKTNLRGTFEILRVPSRSSERRQKEILRSRWENPSENGRYSPSGRNSPRIPR